MNSINSSNAGRIKTLFGGRIFPAVLMMTVVCGLGWGSCHAAAKSSEEQSAKKPLTVLDTIEVKQVMESKDGKDIELSPDGKRYLLALQQGDLKRNGTWLELFSGATDSLANARPQLVARLFTTNTGEIKPTHPGERCFEWMSDSEHVALLWNDGSGKPTQVVSVDVRTHKVETVTHQPTDVVRFVDGGGNTLLISTLAPHSKEKANRLLHDGFAVSSERFYSILTGDVDGWEQWTDYKTYLSSGANKPVREVVVNGRGDERWFPGLAKFSPDRARIIVQGQPEKFPTEWERYTGDSFKLDLHKGFQDPDARVQIWQMYVIDAKTGASRRLWEPPSAWAGSGAVWSPDGRSVLLGPTYLPLDDADKAGMAGNAFVEVEVEMGKYTKVPIPSESAGRIMPVSWGKDGVIEIGNHGTSLLYSKKDGHWQPLSKREGERKEPVAAAVKIDLRQDPNTPPALYGVETASGQEQMLLDLNPQLRTDFTLGRVEIVQWKDKENRDWHGRLYYPVHYAPGQRFPLLIQTHCYSATEFSLLGCTQLTSDYAAQPLANQDIAVLQMEDKSTDKTVATPLEPEMYMSAYEAAIDHFAEAGLVDRNKVGLQGFSRTGWHVEYTLTHSSFPYAAAYVADNMDASYFQAGLNSGWSDEYVLDNGAPPYGEGLKTWLEHAPGFNADKMHTPLRLQVDSGGLPAVLSDGWEMFTRLRDLKKPVEYYVVPDIVQGVHDMVIPRQQVASRSGLVDWMTFWLKGSEDPDPSKAEQYKRWRELRKLDENSKAANHLLTVR